MGLFFALPAVLPELFSGQSQLSLFAVRLFELVQLVFASVLEADDVARMVALCKLLLPAVPDVFPAENFGSKPKFHYGLGHIATCIERHGPSAFWSSFAFESRLGDLKRACLLVGNNKSVAARGGNIIYELFALSRRTSRCVGTPLPFIDWINNTCDVAMKDARELMRTADEVGLPLATYVVDMERFEGLYSAFSRGAFVVPYAYDSVPVLSSSHMFFVRRICGVQGPYTRRLLC